MNPEEALKCFHKLDMNHDEMLVETEFFGPMVDTCKFAEPITTTKASATKGVETTEAVTTQAVTTTPATDVATTQTAATATTLPTPQAPTKDVDISGFCKKLVNKYTTVVDAFSAMDENESQFVGSKEFARVAGKLTPPVSAGVAQATFAKMDGNSDGKLESFEFFKKCNIQTS